MTESLRVTSGCKPLQSPLRVFSPGLYPELRAEKREPWLQECVQANVTLMAVNRELKHKRFWDTDGNRKRTFRVLGKYCLPDFYTTRL